MRTVIVFDHPYTAAACDNEPHNRSFSAAICKAVTEKLRAKGEEVDLIDLHADGFDPVMSRDDLANWRKGAPMNDQVAGYQARLREADRIVFVFPIWWELMPAMTKGFIDKVYAKNVLYNQGKGKRGMSTLLSPQTQVVAITTMGTPLALYKTVLGKPVVKALRLGMCRKTGLKNFRWIPFAGVDGLSLEERRRLLDGISL